MASATLKIHQTYESNHRHRHTTDVRLLNFLSQHIAISIFYWVKIISQFHLIAFNIKTVKLCLVGGKMKRKERKFLIWIDFVK